MKYLTVVFTLVLFFMLSACSQPATIQTGQDAVKDDDGLNKVSGTPFDKAFADAVANLKQYTQFNVADLDLSEIDVIDPRLDMGRTSKWDFNDKDATQMAEYYKKEVAEAFAKNDKFGLTDATGPGVMLVKSKITRFAPTAPKYDSIDRGSRSKFYSQTTGDLTIVTQLLDSETNQVLVNLEDNRDLGNSTQMRENTRGQYSMDLRNAFSRWASNLVNQLNEIQNRE